MATAFINHFRSYLLLLSLVTVCNRVSAQGFQWVYGINASGLGGIGALTFNDENDVYAVGMFTGTKDFDLGPGVASLTSVGSNNMFLLKQDAAGNFLWVKQFPGSPFNPATANLGGRGIATDLAGNIYIGGAFTDTFDFDPGPATYYMWSETAGTIANTAFVVKLTANGEFIWAKKIGGANGSVSIVDMKMDDAHIYLSGGFGGTLDVDPGPGVVNLTSTSTTGSNGFLEKLDTAGNYVWAKIARVGLMALDPASNIYGTGAFQGTEDFDPGPGVFNQTANATGVYDIAIVKLDSAANFQWAKQIGDNESDVPQDIAVDRWGNVVVVGYYRGIVDFDPGPGVFNLNAPSRDMFTLRLTTDGALSWAKSAHPPANDDARAVAVDSAGSVYTAGEFQGGGDMDPGPGVYMVYGGLYIQKLDSSGNFVWARGWDADIPRWIGLDNDQNIYMIGSFSVSNIDFDPGPNIHTIPGNPTNGNFLLKLCPSVPLTISSTVLTGGTIVAAVGQPVSLTGAGYLDSGTTPVPAPYHVVWSSNGVPFDTTYDSFATTYSLSAAGVDTITAVLWAESIHCADTATASVRIADPTGVGSLPNGGISAIQVYPNPANRSFMLKDLNVKARLKLTDLAGRLLKSWTATSAQQSYDISEIAPGYYLLTVEDERGTPIGTKAIVKQ